MRGGKIALVRSKTDGFYKFPGGGIEPGEDRLNALIRETREETGLRIIPRSAAELGLTREIRRKNMTEEAIFKQNSYYYTADVEDAAAQQNLTEDEKKLGYELVWTDMETAYQANAELGKQYETAFILREAFVLQYLMDLHK
jgi:8-oxo-dGTP pyrophosphatase MutT (NUDIX family)